MKPLFPYRMIPALIAGLACSTPATGQYLQSSDHDLLQLKIVTGEMDHPMPDADQDKHLVTVCLRDNHASNQRKAFDTQADAPPRFVVPFKGKRCARFEPTRQVFYFSKSNGNALRLVMSYRLDLRNYRGANLVFDWVSDSQLPSQ